MSGIFHSVPTETDSIQGETGSFRPFVTHPRDRPQLRQPVASDHQVEVCLN
jgi:hypothetical protein